ncbi:MAG: macrolide ABC transporter ATP-binding protein [Gammaproteobacteria bacterium TMED78]|nr:MAG: macrolide ABC transporter ATP-binding protein [Gammaproteobacteria bacterium TMED78]|tara:strand:+ start:285 stop:983 length:699 start_codon:yes stop_codon:yes gene_type:complete
MLTEDKKIIIETNNLERRYSMGAETIYAIKDISFNIASGEYVAIMGPSGSGKSTLMNIIGCLDTLDGGSYSLNGTPVSDLTDTDLAAIRNNDIGFIFQTFNLLGRSSAIQNVEVPLIYNGVKKAERYNLAKAALNSVGLSDRLHHRPNELSGGQRQRVAIARAMIMNPSILLADEPTGNLDSSTGIDIMNLFKKLHNLKHTIILVTHDHTIAKHADRIITLKDGIVESDIAI